MPESKKPLFLLDKKEMLSEDVLDMLFYRVYREYTIDAIVEAEHILQSKLREVDRGLVLLEPEIMEELNLKPSKVGPYFLYYAGILKNLVKRKKLMPVTMPFAMGIVVAFTRNDKPIELTPITVFDVSEDKLLSLGMAFRQIGIYKDYTEEDFVDIYEYFAWINKDPLSSSKILGLVLRHNIDKALMFKYLKGLEVAAFHCVLSFRSERK